MQFYYLNRNKLVLTLLKNSRKFWQRQELHQDNFSSLLKVRFSISPSCHHLALKLLNSGECRPHSWLCKGFLTHNYSQIQSRIIRRFPKSQIFSGIPDSPNHRHATRTTAAERPSPFWGWCPP